MEDGIEGLVHVSEMDWTNKNANPSKVVSLGQEAEVIVLDIDEERRRISLGMKECQPKPWTIFEENNKSIKILRCCFSASYANPFFLHICIVFFTITTHIIMLPFFEQ